MEPILEVMRVLFVTAIVTISTAAFAPGAGAHTLPLSKARMVIIDAGNAYYSKRGLDVDTGSVRCQRKSRHAIACTYSLSRAGESTSSFAGATAFYPTHASRRVRLTDRFEGSSLP